MADDRLQSLKRRWLATRDPGVEAELLQERLRAGDLTSRQLELAAHLDHPAARAALPEFALTGYGSWLAGLGAWSDRLALRAYALVLAELSRAEHPANHTYFSTAEQDLARGESPNARAAADHLNEHPAVTPAGAWCLALMSLDPPPHYLPPEHPERTKAHARLLREFAQGRYGQTYAPHEVRYDHTHHRADGWVHEFSLVPDEGQAVGLAPTRARPGWSPEQPFESAPPGRGVLDRLHWTIPDTPELRAAVRAKLIPEILGWDD